MVKRCCLNFDKIFKKCMLRSLLFSTAAGLEPTTSQNLNSFISIFEISCLKIGFNLLCILRFTEHLSIEHRSFSIQHTIAWLLL